MDFIIEPLEVGKDVELSIAQIAVTCNTGYKCATGAGAFEGEETAKQP